jgi:hypothetical protein
VAHKEMLSKVYKELMILGFIAFAVSPHTNRLLNVGTRELR